MLIVEKAMQKKILKSYNNMYTKSLGENEMKFVEGTTGKGFNED